MPAKPEAAPAVETRYDAMRRLQAKTNEHDARRRQVMANKGVILPDEAEPPFDPNPDVLPYGHVRVRILKRGHNKISMGLSLPLEDDKFPNHHQGEILAMPAETADHYENHPSFGWVETVE